MTEKRIKFFGEDSGRRLSAAVLCAVMALSDVPCISALAGETSGSCGDAAWTLSDDGTLTITGSGSEGDDCYVDRGDWGWNVTSIVMEGNITEIGYEAFAGLEDLTSVVFPSSLKYIDDYSFNECSSLKEADLSSCLNFEGMYECAFAECTSLERVVFPDTGFIIGSYAFEKCKSLDNLTIPAGDVDIWESAFKGCDSLSTITVEEGSELYTVDEDGVFWNINEENSWKRIIFYPVSITATSYTVPSDITSIDDGAFSSNKYLQEIIVEDGADYYYSEDGVLLSGGENEYDDVNIECYPKGKTSTSYTVPENVYTLAEYSFAENTYLETVTMPESTQHIYTGVFYGCTSLKSVTFSEHLASIGHDAFYGCTSLEIIELPAETGNIGDNVFTNCTSLSEVTFNEGYLGHLGSEVFMGCTSLKEIEIPSTIQVLLDGLFSGCTSLTTVTLPSGICEISDDVFYGCTSLTTINFDGTEDDWDAVYIGEGNDILSDVKIVYREFYYNLADDGTLTISGSGSMPDYSENEPAPWAGDSVTSVIIENGIKTIGDYAFYGCESITKIKVYNNGLRSIGTCALSGTSISSISLPESLTTLKGYAFSECNNLTNITLPASLLTIDNTAFVSCENLQTINVAEGNSQLCSENGVLYDADKSQLLACGGANPYVEDFILPDDTVFIYEYAFSGCKTIKTLSTTENSGLVYIYNHAFADCTSLTEVNFLGGAYSIADYSFSGCTSLSSVTLITNTRQIYPYAFGGCTSLKTVNYSGNEDDWNNINIYEGNECLTNAYYATVNSDGNVNGDDTTDSKDAALIMKYASGIISADEINTEHADINRDGKADILDAVQILKTSEEAA